MVSSTTLPPSRRCASKDKSQQYHFNQYNLMGLINSLSSGVSALTNFSRSLEVVGDNIANVNTTGFKSSRVDFADSFSQTLQRSTASNAVNGGNTASNQIGSGLSIAGIKSDFTQGSVVPTGVNTDLAIVGNGYFKVSDFESGQQFLTRSGSFRMDDLGNVVTYSGEQLMGVASPFNQLVANVDTDGNLFFSTQEITPTPTVSTDGGNLSMPGSFTVAGGQIVDNTGGAFTTAEIEAAVPGVSDFSFDSEGLMNLTLEDGNTYISGRISLVSVSDSQALMKEGDNLYSNLDAAGVIGEFGASSNGLGYIKSGALEQSNVDLAEQFAELITSQRSFQAGSRIITVSDEILSEIVNLKR